MNKPDKCKNCQWYGKPYWSITNPCDNCPMENVETFTRWVDPTIKEKDKEIEKLNRIIEIKTNRIQELMKRLSKRQEKVEELNNIINELEKTLNEGVQLYKEYIKERLKELKGEKVSIKIKNNVGITYDEIKPAFTTQAQDLFDYGDN